MTPTSRASNAIGRIAIATVILCITSVRARADSILHWNRIASDLLVEDTFRQNPGMASRSMAMLNLAMYDAINGIRPQHRQFYDHTPAPQNASIDAAIGQAAFEVLAAIYPEQRLSLETDLTATLGKITDGPAKTDGVAYGRRVAEAVVADRSSDGFDNATQYQPDGGVGRWEPDPLNPDQEAWGPQWGAIRPFAIGSTARFPIQPPPSIASAEYADAFAEVADLGAIDSPSRTADQTEIAQFWAYDRLGMGTPMRLYNDVLRTVAETQGNRRSENARMFAMAFTSVADAGIVAWDSKFTHDYWRPVSGIRRADVDGNPLTSRQPDWTPLGAPGGVAPDGSTIASFTPPFPTYLSGHASFGGALFESLTNFYGTDDISFEVASEEAPGVLRQYDSFGEANEENGRSRVYLGIHWSFDDTRSREMATLLADYVSANFFVPVPEPNGGLLGFAAFLLGQIGRRHGTRFSTGISTRDDRSLTVISAQAGKLTMLS